MSEPAVTWVYAVVPGAAPAAPVGAVTGVAGEPVRLLPHAGISAVVGSVSQRQAEPAALRRRLADPDWLAHAARSHHRVVTACFGAVPTVPFRLATIYHDDERVAGMLAARHGELVAALATVAGCAEWGVQAIAAGPDLADHPAPAADPARRGTAYLELRRAQRAAAEARRRSTAAAAEELHRGLAAVAAASVRPAGAGRPPASRDGQRVLDAAYLVDDRRREEFTGAAGDLSRRHPGIRLRLTGPWPAYSFVGPAGEAAG